MSSEEGNQGGNGQPQQTLHEEKHESPKPQFLDPVRKWHLNEPESNQQRLVDEKVYISGPMNCKRCRAPN